MYKKYVRNVGPLHPRGSSSPSKSRSAYSPTSRPQTGGSFPRGIRRISNGGYGGYKGGRGGGGNRFSKHIDVSKFINKAVITEAIDNFVPEHTFANFPIDSRLKANITKKGYDLPTPIQDKIIPHILRGLDVVGIANTGTGKTAAFLIPLIDKVLKFPKEQTLIVVPTRELAIQIEDEFKGFATGLKLYSVSCVGGAPIGRQISELKYHNEFIIGTPGRLRDLMDRKLIKLENFKTLVLDEADRMLDMGFINEVKYMVSKMPKDRHTLFFSATMSKEIEILIKDFLKNPVTVSVKTGDTAKNVDQDVVRVPKEKTKLDILSNLLKETAFEKVLIFGRTKHGVHELAEQLKKRGFSAESIHGDKNHGQRQRALKLFKESHTNILVATDVAARGLDIAGITHVINFDIPATYEDYVHRIGRTGRAGKKGRALTFIQ